MKNKKFIKFGIFVFTLVLIVLPTLSLAQGGAAGTSCFSQFDADGKIGGLFNYATCIISSAVVPLIFALAFMMFLWGVVQYVLNSDEEAKKAQGRQFMIWGIIALFVMFSVWGLVGILGETFGVTTNVIPRLPQ